MKSLGYLYLSLIIIFAPLKAISQVPQLESTSPVVQNAKWAQSWWMDRHKEKIQIKNTMQNVDLVFLGDSITHAWDKPEKGLAVWQQFYQPRNAINIGFSGDRTEHVLWRLKNGTVDNISPKLLVLMIGTNNAGHRAERSEHTAAGIKAIIDELKTRLPNTKILHLAIFPRGQKPDHPLRIINDKTNSLIKNFADNQQVFFLDINHIFLSPDGSLSKNVMSDFLHPNKNQYIKWALAIEQHVKKLLME